MEPLKLKRTAAQGPEADIQREIIKMLRYKGWYVKRIAASTYLSGLPDLYATHYNYKARWIEIKLPNMKGSRFTAAQLEEFPKLCANGAGVWVLTAATEREYDKLFEPCNWTHYNH